MMSKAAKSVFAFGFYCLISGLGFLFTPNLLITTLGFAPSQEAWPRILGGVLIAIAYYYMQAARHEVKAFFRFSVSGRIAVSTLFVGMAVSGWAEPMLAALAVVEFSAAIWTMRVMRE